MTRNSSEYAPFAAHACHDALRSFVKSHSIFGGHWVPDGRTDGVDKIPP